MPLAVARILLAIMAAASAHAAAEPPSIADVDRYLSASGLRTVLIQGQRIAAASGVQRGLMSAATARCFESPAVTGSYIADVIRPLALASITDAADIRAAIAFAESPVGQKIAAHMENEQVKAVAAALRGEAIPRPGLLDLTQTERQQVAQWSSSAPFIAMRVFELTLLDMRNSREFQDWNSSTKQRCSR